jgi:hypothetical protein
LSKRKTPQERLEEMEQKMEQLKAKKLQLQAQVSQQERKARTRRLIEIGAIFEKNFDIDSVETAQKMALALRPEAQKLISVWNNDEIIELEEVD